MDLLLTLKWLDPNIITNFSEIIRKDGGMALRPEKIEKIWIPDLYNWNRTALKAKDEWALLKTAKILTTDEINEEEGTHEKTTVEMKYEIKTSVYCKFEYSQYPMDSQNCSINIGSSSNVADFQLHDENKRYHGPKAYGAVGLNMKIRFFSKNNHTKENTVGCDIQMNRLMVPFMMKYYVPSLFLYVFNFLHYSHL